MFYLTDLIANQIVSAFEKPKREVLKMGYRELIKKYMSHVDSLVGSNLVELAAITNSVNKREMGELRSLAAELKRESFQNNHRNRYAQIIREMTQSGTIELEDLTKIKGIEANEFEESIPDDKFQRIIKTLAETPH